MQTGNSNSTSINFRLLARALTIVENDLTESADLLKSLVFDKPCPVIGITGPPGAGKSTLVSALIAMLLQGGKKIAVLAIDPTSPFNFGSLLADRVRMGQHFNNPDVFIRSLATRGSLGGLSAKTIEMADVLRAAGFDYVLIETVGVGQSEVEIAGLADITLVVLVPEGGDEMQHIKSGLMEIADAFIVNKADRPDTDVFANNLKKIIGQKQHQQTPVFKTIASQAGSITDVVDFIKASAGLKNTRRELLLTEKAYKLIQHKLTQHVDKKKLQLDVAEAITHKKFNLYSFVYGYCS